MFAQNQSEILISLYNIYDKNDYNEYLHVAKHYYLLDQNTKVIKYLDLYRKSLSENDLNRKEMFLYYSLSNYKLGYKHNAKEYLKKIRENKTNDYETDLLLFHYYIFDMDQEKASRLIESMLSDYPAQNMILKKYQYLLSDLQNMDLINPDFVRTLSKYLPGLGQLYIGEYKNGILSFSLTSASLGMTVHNVLIKDWFSAVVSFSYLLNKFYSGSSETAYLLARKKNKELFNSWLNKVYQSSFNK